MKLVNYKE